MMSGAVSRNIPHVNTHKLSTSQLDLSHHNGEKLYSFTINNDSRTVARAGNKQQLNPSVRAPTRDSYENFARTKSDKQKISNTKQTRSALKDTENRDPETIRRYSVKYATPETPVAPPTTPVSNYRYDSPSGSPRAILTTPTGGAENVQRKELNSGEVDNVDFLLERSESRQSKYHEECTPQIDPTNVIGSKERREKLNSARSNQASKRRRPSSLVSTNSSLLSHRESVVNVIYTGADYVAERVNTEWFTLPRLSRRASAVFGKMSAITPHPDDVIHSDYDVIQEDNCSSYRGRSSQPLTSSRLSYRPGFLYQSVDFDNLSQAVPTFVRQNVQKNGRLVTESFILKVNYLRRRRALGDNNNSNNNNNPNNKRGQKSLPSNDKGGGRGDGGLSSDHP